MLLDADACLVFALVTTGFCCHAMATVTRPNETASSVL